MTTPSVQPHNRFREFTPVNFQTDIDKRWKLTQFVLTYLEKFLNGVVPYVNAVTIVPLNRVVYGPLPAPESAPAPVVTAAAPAPAPNASAQPLVEALAVEETGVLVEAPRTENQPVGWWEWLAQFFH